jgi:hypothetical protein
VSGLARRAPTGLLAEAYGNSATAIIGDGDTVLPRSLGFAYGQTVSAPASEAVAYI